MRDFVNEKARLLQPSGIRKFFDIVRETEGAISLGVGEPDFVTPWSVRSAAIASLQRGYTQYTANRGMPALLELIARYLETRFSLSFDPAHILLTVGASEGIDLLLRACVERGDEILIPDPAYVSYAPCALMADGTPVAVKCREENGFVPTAEDLEAAVTEKSKILILTYPNNPTGGIADRAALEKIASFAEKHDLLVISDEIYAELTYGQKHVSFASLPRMKERTAYVGGFSKAFAMTGFRLGYACGPEPLISAMMKIHQYSMLCAPITSQEAAIEALQNGTSAMMKMRESYRQRRDFLVKRFNEIGLDCHLPGGAFYAFPDISKFGLSSKEFATRLLMEEQVAAVPGTAFGASGEGFLRCCYATAFDQIKEACNRMERFVKTLS